MKNVIEKLEQLAALQRVIENNEYYMACKIEDKQKNPEHSREWHLHATDTILFYQGEIKRLKLTLSKELTQLAEGYAKDIAPPDESEMLARLSKDCEVTPYGAAIYPAVVTESVNGALHSPEYHE